MSACMPFVGFAVGFVYFWLYYEHQRFDVINWAVRIWAACSILGIAGAIISLVRAERLWGIAAIGILLNLAVVGLCGFWLWNVGR